MTKFNQKLSERLKELDFNLLKYRKNDLLVYKHLENGFVLTLGTIKSNLYNKLFTGAYYLAFTYTWSMISPVFLPDYAYQRIGELFPENTDIWFNENEDGLNKFIEKIKITEGKFIKNAPLLYHTIINQKKYEAYNEYLSLINEILETIKAKENISGQIIQDTVNMILENRKDVRNNKNGKTFVYYDVSNCYYLSPEKNIAIIKEGGNVYKKT
jgi:hypothetical protein